MQEKLAAWLVVLKDVSVKIFLIMLVKIIEMDELEIRMTSTLAKKLIAAFSGCKSISNDILIKEFARSGNSVKQQNLDMIVHSLVERWQDYYNEQWREAKTKIDIEADEYKKRIIEEMRPQ